MTELVTSTASRLSTVDIVVPVYNEERDLDRGIRTLRSYLDAEFPFPTTVTVADNASTDTTWDLACRLAAELNGVRALHLDEKGRGRALRAAWTQSEADIVSYMDVDLSTDLGALLPLVAPLASGHSEVSIGSRLARGSNVIRGPKREVISRIYNLLLRLVLRNRFTDAQCGFKAIRAVDARALLPLVEDEGWFFDTELLVLAERNGLRIHEVPVDWADDPDTRVHIANTAIADLKGVCRLIRTFARGGGLIDESEAGRSRSSSVPGEIGRFVGVGLVSTAVYLALYLILRTQMNGYIANVVSLTLCSIGNLAGHWRYTFRARQPSAYKVRAAAATLALCISVVVTTWCLAVASALDPRSLPAQLVGLLSGNAVAALGRFVMFRAFVFHTHLRSGKPT